MAVHIITDSASDLTVLEGEKLGVTILPLTVRFGDEGFRDGADLSHNQFYAKLEGCRELPTTSQVSPWQFQQVLEALPTEDEAVILTLSGQLSGTLQSALIAAKAFGDRVQVVDTMSVTMGELIQVRYAARMAAAGLAAKTIAREILRRRDEVTVMGVADTLDYLKKGGRISPALAFAGGVLGIKPVVGVRGGVVVLMGRARGLRQGGNLLNTTVEEKGGINFDLPYVVGYSGDDDTAVRSYLKDGSALWKSKTAEVPICQIGATVGTHLGPGAVGVAFYSPENGGALA